MIEEKIIKLRNFNTQEHILANCLKISDSDAMVLLLEELIDHKLKKYPESELIEIINDRNMDLNWDITNARKEVYRRKLKNKIRDANLKHEISRNTDMVCLINIGNVKDIDDANRKKVIKLLPKIFKNNDTRKFIENVLNVGKPETMDILELNEKQFRKKLQNIEYFCRKHREKFINLVVNQHDEELINELNVLKTLETYLNKKDFNMDEWQNLINQHNEYLDDLLGDYADYPINPVRLLNEYADQPHKEQYKLTECIYQRLVEVGDKLR